MSESGGQTKEIVLGDELGDIAVGAADAKPQIGDVMPAGHEHAGWIYAGISKTTHEPFYVAPKDSGVFQWKEAMAFAATDDSRLPSWDELDQIYKARDKGALKGTFNETGWEGVPQYDAGKYWSREDNGGFIAWVQRFRDGEQDGFGKYNFASLRLVR
jgi:hypothetical protein